MAMISEFHQISHSGSERRHSEVECGFKSFELAGETIVQLDTYGSSQRKDKGTISQSIQLDERGAAYLVGLLTRAFPNIKA